MTDKRKPDTPPDAYQRALGLLVRREHSRVELTRKLKARDLNADAVDAALETLQRQGFQDDARFAEALARTRAGSGQGPGRIRFELGTHGLPDDLVEAALEACEVDWDDRAFEILSRRYGSHDLSHPAQQQKAFAFLARRGYSMASARRALTRLRDAQGDDPEAG